MYAYSGVFFDKGPGGNSAGSMTFAASPSGTFQADRSGRLGGHGARAGSAESGRRDSKDSWHNAQSNMQSSGVQKRVSPTKQISVGLLRHDEATGTITLDIRNMPNGESGKHVTCILKIFLFCFCFALVPLKKKSVTTMVSSNLPLP